MDWIAHFKCHASEAQPTEIGAKWLFVVVPNNLQVIGTSTMFLTLRGGNCRFVPPGCGPDSQPLHIIECGGEHEICCQINHGTIPPFRKRMKNHDMDIIICHGRWEVFFQWGSNRGFFQNFSRGPKWWNSFFPTQNWKILFLLNISKSRGPLPPLLTPMLFVIPISTKVIITWGINFCYIANSCVACWRIVCFDWSIPHSAFVMTALRHTLLQAVSTRFGICCQFSEERGVNHLHAVL